MQIFFNYPYFSFWSLQGCLVQWSAWLSVVSSLATPRPSNILWDPIEASCTGPSLLMSVSCLSVFAVLFLNASLTGSFNLFVQMCMYGVCICVCVCMWACVHMCACACWWAQATICLWKWKHNLHGSVSTLWVLSLTQVGRLGGKAPLPLSHLAWPISLQLLFFSCKTISSYFVLCIF